jgi:predicted transcriptional regulator
MEDRKYEKHESYGMIQISRLSGGLSNLFGSSIQHGHTIAVRIKTAKLCRYLNTDWYHDQDEVVEIELSPTQFTEAITNMNTNGVPCTIRRVQGKRMENPPSKNKKQEFEDEFSDRMKEVAKKLSKLTEQTEKILSSKKAPTKAEKETILHEIGMLNQEVRSNMPFAYRCFNEQMDKTVTEAKGEVEAFVTNKITSLGIKALQDEFNTKLLED